MFSKRLVGQLKPTAAPTDGWDDYRRALELIVQSDVSQALPLLAEAELNFLAADDQQGLWRALLGQALLHWHDAAAALAAARAAALRVAEGIDDGFAVGCVAWQIATMLLGQGEHLKAADYLDQAQLALDAAGLAPPGGTLAAAAQLCNEIRRWQQMFERQQIGRREAESAIDDIQRDLITRLNQAADSMRATPLVPLVLGGPEMLLLLPAAPPPFDFELAAMPPSPGLSAWLRRLWRLLVYGDDLTTVEPLTRVPAPEPALGLAAGDAQPTLDEPTPPAQPGEAAPALAALAETPDEPGVAALVLRPQELEPAHAYVGDTGKIATPAEPATEAPDGATEPAGAELPEPPTLSVQLLGGFRVTLNGQAVESWPSGRGRAVFKYLLAHRERSLPRDTIMETFWPDAAPESARNSLNVALHGLRQALKAVADTPVVVFQNGAYHVSPELRVWIDVEEFKRRVQAGRRLEDAGSLGAAAAEYEQAAALYQGDFMGDDLYDDWPVLPRERLRVAYLDTLDRLSTIYFGQSQYAACVTLCQQILAHDRCREDAHCRLMCCYSRQGQHHLALRQFQLCAEALRAELDVAPAPNTTQLYERLRRHEQV